MDRRLKISAGTYQINTSAYSLLPQYKLRSDFSIRDGNIEPSEFVCGTIFQNEGIIVGTHEIKKVSGEEYMSMFRLLQFNSDGRIAKSAAYLQQPTFERDDISGIYTGILVAIDDEVRISAWDRRENLNTLTSRLLASQDAIRYGAEIRKK